MVLSVLSVFHDHPVRLSMRTTVPFVDFDTRPDSVTFVPATTLEAETANVAVRLVGHPGSLTPRNSIAARGAGGRFETKGLTATAECAFCCGARAVREEEPGAVGPVRTGNLSSPVLAIH